MRVGIIALQHESNTFLSTPTTIENFRQDVLVTGEDVHDTFANAHHEVGGFFDGLADANIDAVPIFAARAVPSGVITAECEAELLTSLLRELDRSGEIDGMLVAPHGAAVGAQYADFDGHWLMQIREKILRKPMICTLDLHANVSQRMIDACDATIGYRTNPHLDQRQRGIEAAILMARTLRGEIKPTQALATPPVAINIERQLTDDSPCRELYALADAQLRQNGVLSNSVLLGFPYADVAEMGTSAIVVTDNDAALARTLADEIGDYIVSNRQQFVGEMISVDSALDAIAAGEKPVCLLDTGDNVGGGSPADGTVLVAALHARGAGRWLAMIYDPQSVEAATCAGVGAELRMSIGAKTDDLHGASLVVDCDVISIHDGQWTETQIRHGGHSRGEMGPTAVVRTDRGGTIILTSRRQPPFTLAPIRACNLNPADFDVHVAKGVHAPVAAYREVCRRFIRVNTPGVTNADMTQLAFRHRRKPLFPFE